ncbi:phosphotransferase [Archangium minus]|uniref:Phosphotransferase n=1 Tax=Archangium minus TaxID=83450 RepID=A0ABY9WV56_9BACT|nr:phosphotransferase [Archangium minus]
MSFAEFEAFRRHAALWLPAATDIARQHSLMNQLEGGEEPLKPFAEGSNLVAAIGSQYVLKIFPPMLRHQFVAERASLRQLHGRLSVSIPEIVVEGEREGWPYLVITRMDGVTGEALWPALSENEKEDVMRQIGELIAEVQRVPPGPLLELEPRWPDFLRAQLDKCHARHARQGLPPPLLDELREYLSRAPEALGAPVLNGEPTVLLTGEYIQQNFLLKPGAGGGWRLSGLIDFGDVMTGWGEYDLLGPSTFMGGGMPGRIHQLLRGYGYGDAEINPTLRRRLMMLFLLHRFSDPLRQVRIESWPDRVRTLEALERLIWPLS